MRILQVVSTPPFAWATGGCSRVVYGLSKALSERGHDVTIMTTDQFESHQRYPAEELIKTVDNVKILRYRNLSDALAWRKIYFAPGMIFDLGNRIKNVDIVHLHDIISIHAIFVSKQCLQKNVPYVLTMHGSGIWLRRKAALNYLLTKGFLIDVLRKAAYVTSMSEREHADYRSLTINDDRIIDIPNGIDVEEFRKKVKKSEFRKMRSIETEEKIVLYLGRVHSSKHLELLLEAFAEVNAAHRDTRLVICGPDDGYISELQAIAKGLGISERMIVTGYLKENEKIQAMTDSDVFVTPSFTGFPITFLEACICRVPIVTTNLNDNLDWINNQVGIVTNYNATAMANAIERILYDQDLAEKFRKNQQELLYSRFNWKMVAASLENVYRRCIDEKKSN